MLEANLIPKQAPANQNSLIIKFLKPATPERFHNSMIGSFIYCQDRFEKNLLELFAHPENTECFSIISVITFEVNIVAEQKKACW